MQLSATDGHHSVLMDAKAPVGSDSALNPKQLVLSGLCGCTAMDVLALLKKHQLSFKSFRLSAEAKMSEKGHPKVFETVLLTFDVEGDQVDAKILQESVLLSQTRYCGVSAMLSKAVEIQYVVNLNGVRISAGKADFSRLSV